VGTVESIQFPSDLQRQQAHVRLSVQSEYMNRVREDSRAFIDSKGLLGDKIVNITLGSAVAPQILDGATLKTKGSPSMEHLATQVQDALSAVTKVTQTADSVISQVATEEVRADIGRIMRSIANILKEVETGDGVAHRVVYDRKYADELEAILVETRQTIARMRGAMDRIDHVVAEVQHGDGMLHEVVYGEKGKRALDEMGNAATEMTAVVAEIRQGDGLLHDLIFEEDEGRILDDLAATASRINRLTEDIAKGRGTLGGLVVDPSVYEDLKSILGNVERSVLLKAVMRFAIKEGDIERPAYVPQAPADAPADR
jgi:phospholipid/cholesterol/gamma-HCH transport system substrate-binding protein